jgi:hypothetical protein
MRDTFLTKNFRLCLSKIQTNLRNEMIFFHDLFLCLKPKLNCLCPSSKLLIGTLRQMLKIVIFQITTSQKYHSKSSKYLFSNNLELILIKVITLENKLPTGLLPKN